MNGTPANDTKLQNEAFTTFKRFILDCPEEHLVRLFEMHTGVDVIPDFVEVEISHSLGLLKQMAALGSEDAVRNLANIGIRISDFLEALAGAPEDKIQKNLDKGKYTPRFPDPDANWDAASLELAKAWNVLSEAPLADLERILVNLDSRMPAPVLLPDATHMFSDLAFRNSRRTIEAGGDTAGSEGAAPGEAGGTVNEPPLTGTDQGPHTDPQMIADKKRANEVDLILSRILNFRAAHLARVAVRKVLEEAKKWPLTVIAPQVSGADTAEERTGRMGLGSKLGYLLPKPKKGNEAVRLGVNAIFEVLEAERTRSLALFSGIRREYQAYEDGLNSYTAPPKGNGIKSGNSWVPDLQLWNSSNHWLRKAALLPPPSPEGFHQWVDAAMSYLTCVASEASYNELVLKELIQTGAQRSNLARRLVRLCPACGCAVDRASCGACAKEKAGIESEYSEFSRREIQLLEKWEKGVALEFENFKWPPFISNRSNQTEDPQVKSCKVVAKEKIENGFRSILKREGCPKG